jgi:hypothetical protein
MHLYEFYTVDIEWLQSIMVLIPSAVLYRQRASTVERAVVKT